MNPDIAAEPEKSQVEILKSTAMVGAASLINIALGMVRSKVIAILLGPSGVGLISLYNSVVDITTALANVGVQNSGVRQIAVAASSADNARVAQTATIMRRLSLLFGLLGGAILVAVAAPISELTFGDHQHQLAIACLAGAVLFRSLAAGATAVVQGMRRIADIAKINIISALSSTLGSIVLVYLLSEGGVVPSLIVGAAASAAVSWWYCKRLQLLPAHIGASEALPEVKILLRLGVVFAVSELLTLGSIYIVRITVLQYHGFAAAGLYQAAWTLGGLYAGFILQAMGADFYPRLAGAAHDNSRCNRLVNEQISISILIASPGIIATLTFAPFVMTMFYSAEFQPGVGLVRWICLGMGLRIIAWPMGFIMLAKGAQRLILVTEIWAATVHVGLAWVLVANYSFEGAGVAFLSFYVSHTIVVYLVVRRLSGFRWSTDNALMGSQFVLSATLTFGSFHILSFWPATTVGIMVLGFNTLISVRRLSKIFSADMIPPALRPLLARFN